MKIHYFFVLFRLLDMSIEEKMKQPMPEDEIYQMPKLIPENRRSACPDNECNYVTVDAFMLVAHMEHLHTDFANMYKCPHCPPELNVSVPFDEVEFHLRCHGDLLFKVSIY